MQTFCLLLSSPNESKYISNVNYNLPYRPSYNQNVPFSMIRTTVSLYYIPCCCAVLCCCYSPLKSFLSLFLSHRQNKKVFVMAPTEMLTILFQFPLIIILKAWILPRRAIHHRLRCRNTSSIFKAMLSAVWQRLSDILDKQLPVRAESWNRTGIHRRL